MEITEKRGELVGGLVLKDSDDVISVTQGGQVTRSLYVPAFRPRAVAPWASVSCRSSRATTGWSTIARNAELPGTETAEDEAADGDEPDAAPAAEAPDKAN